jgi:uncharacterized membrane protein YbhN (UPF0104 family)
MVASCAHDGKKLVWSSRTANLVTFIVAVVLFAVSGLYVARQFQWREAFNVLLKGNFLKLIILISISHFGYIVVRAWRWRSAVRASVPNIAFSDFYWITAVIVSLSNFTPGPFGEALKIEIMKRRGLLGRLPGIGAFALERTMDLVMVSSMAAVGLVFGNFAAPYPDLRIWAAVLAAMGLIALCGFLYFDPGGWTSLWLARLRPSGSSKTWVLMAFLTILSWVLIAISWQIALSAVQIHLALSQVLLLISLVTIGAIVSFIPGGLGVSEMVSTTVLTNMGVLPVTAQAGALILRAYTLIAFLFGLVHLGLWPFYQMHSHRYQITDENSSL